MITSISIITNPKYDDISELAVYAQKLAQNSGDHIEETVHPVFVDGSLGYSFTTTYHIAAMDGPIFHKQILTEHDGKTYTIQLQYHVSHYLLAYPEIEHTVDSIKFFD